MIFPRKNNDIEQYPLSVLEIGALLLVALSVIVILGTVLTRSHYGIDLTDEGFYMNSMTDPSSYHASATQFGFIYHPIYKIANGNIALIRQINYLITFALAWLLCLILFGRMAIGSLSTFAGRFSTITLTAAIACSSFLIICFELPQTPSYNTLVFQSMLLAVMGMVIADATFSRLSCLGQVLVGVGGWLAFMAKPPTAAALGLVIILYFSLAGKLRLRLLCISATVAVILLLSSALAIDGSITGFVGRLTKGIELGRILADGNTATSIWRWDSFQLSFVGKTTLFLNAMLVFACISLGVSERRGYRAVSIGICIACALASIMIFADGYALKTSFERYRGLQILALPIGCLFAVFITRGKRAPTRDNLALIIVFLLLPHVYAFGTDRPYWLNAQGAAFFWILSAVVLVSMIKKDVVVVRVFLPVCVGVQLMTALFLFASMEHPQRQTQPLWLNRDSVDFGHQGNQLILSHDFAEYIRDLRQLARDGGLRPATSVIDLTGHSPGAVYALDGRAIGVPWLLGGYKGSDAFAIAGLDMTPRDKILSAWIITEPLGPGKLSESILERYGIDLKRDYEDLGSVHTPVSPFPVSYTQHLWKPRR